MKSVILGILAAVLLAVAGWYVTEQLNTSSAERYTSPNNSVRID